MSSLAKPLLIPDLDETLIHAREDPFEGRVSEFPSLTRYHALKRPGVDRFLDIVSAHYSLAVWSSASKDYVGAVVQDFLTQRVPLEFVWDSSRCTLRRGGELDESHWVKDLKKVHKKGYDLSRVVAVDDSPEKYLRHYGNLVRVDPWEGDPGDRELDFLAPYLVSLTTVPDVRAVEKRGWKWRG